MLILNTKQDYQHFHQPTPLAPLLHNYRNAPIQPIPIPFLLLLPNSFLSISLTQLLHPLYNKHSPHKPFTSTTIQRQLLAIARNRASLPLFTSQYPSTQPSVFIQQSHASNAAAILLQPPSTHLHPLNHLPSHHPFITILSSPFRNHPHSNALHTHPIPLSSIPNALPSHSLSIQTYIPNRVLSSP